MDNLPGTLFYRFLKAVIRRSPFYYPLKNWTERRSQAREFREWIKNGQPVPPPHVIKQQTLREFAKRFGLKVLVETGTYRGDMVEALKRDFDRIYSIELSQELYTEAKKRFRGKQSVELIHGDSGIELGNLINRIEQPTLFWLDGHYSAGNTAMGAKKTPIYEELEHILNAPGGGHVIIIDDARLFGTDPAYPGIEELGDFIKSEQPGVSIIVENDSIRITPSPVPSHATPDAHR